MKKILSIAFLAMFALVLTGCGQQKLVCDMGEGNMIIYFKNGKVSNVKAEMIMDSKEEAKAICAKSSEYKCSGKKVTTNMPKSKLEQVKGLTKEQVLEAIKEEGYTCK